jgi:hypothetical protein
MPTQKNIEKSLHEKLSKIMKKQHKIIEKTPHSGCFSPLSHLSRCPNAPDPF